MYRQNMKGDVFASLVVLFTMVAFVFMVLTFSLFPIGREPSQATVTMNVINPAKSTMVLPTLLNVTVDDIQVKNSVGKSPNTFRDREKEEALMLYFNNPSESSQMKSLIEERFLRMFEGERFKAELKFTDGTSSDSIISKDDLPEPDNRKILTSTGQVAGPRGKVYDVTLDMYVNEEEEGYKKTAR